MITHPIPPKPKAFIIPDGGYREWMDRHGVDLLERTSIDGQSGLLIAWRNGEASTVSIYEHGPDDGCANPDECGGGMFGWTPLDGALQILEMRWNRCQ